MKKLVLILLLLFAIKADGQNAYYDSKYIIDWLKNPKSSDPKLEGMRQVKVYNKLKLYIDQMIPTSEDPYHYFIVDTIFAEFFKRNETEITLDKYRAIFLQIPLNYLKGKFPGDATTFNKIAKIIKRRDEHDKVIPLYQTAIDEINKIIDNKGQFHVIADSPVKINGLAIPLYTAKKNNDTIRLWGKTTFALNRLNELDTNRVFALSDLRDSLQKGIEWMEDRKSGFDGDARNLFIALSTNARNEIIKKAFSEKNAGPPPFDDRPKLNNQEVQLQSEIRLVAQQSQPTVQLSNFKMPSQAEVIDALAIYVAKRFKQEAIIYMVDQLKENMLADTLFTIMFPETRKLLFSLNAFSIPRFGTEWKYAISKDYTLMPDHLLGNEYIGSKFNSGSFNSMHDAWLMAKMIEKKYSFVEIMRNYASIEPDKLKTPVMRTFANWSNMFNEELFTREHPEIFGREWDSLNVMKPAVESADYWITPSTFAHEINPEQLSLLLVMLKNRYSYNVEGQLGINLSSSIVKQKQKLDKIKQWMSRNLLILNQFQTNQGKLFSREASDDERSLFNGVSYWTFMNDIVEAFVDTNVMHIKGFAPAQLQYISNLNEIYGSFQNKNYPAAISQLMGVIEHLCSENTDYMVSQGLNVYYKDGLISLTQSKDRLVNTLSTYSTYFSPATNTNDIESMRRTATNNIDGVKMVLDDGGVSYDRSVFDKLSKELATFDWKNNKENEKIKNEVTDLKKKLAITDINYMMDSIAHLADSSVQYMALKYNERLGGYQNCYCRSLGKARSYASLLTDIMNSGSNSQNLSRVIEAHAAPTTSYKLKRYNRSTLDIGAYLGTYVGVEILPQDKTSKATGVYGLTVPVGFNYTWATLKDLNPAKVKYPFAKKNQKVREFTGVSHTIGLSIIDIAAPVAYRLTKGADGALPKELKWSQLLSPGLHYRYGFKNAPICLSTGVQYTPQLRTIAGNNELSAVRAYVAVLFDMPLFFLSK